jgi:Short C-terminal domain
MPLRNKLAARRAAKAGGPAQGTAPAQAAPVAAAPLAPAPAPPASDSPDDKMSELKELGDLHDQGVLTDDEFEAQKKKILAEL